MLQGNMVPNVPQEQIDEVAKLVQELGDEWDRDCSLAHELGQFDIDRSTWIAKGIAAKVTRWVPGVQYTPAYKIDNLLHNLNKITKDCGYDEMPLYGAPMTEMIEEVIRELDLKVIE